MTHSSTAGLHRHTPCLAGEPRIVAEARHRQILWCYGERLCGWLVAVITSSRMGGLPDTANRQPIQISTTIGIYHRPYSTQLTPLRRLH